MKDYEKASGQQINFLKSSLQFRHKVPDSVRLEVQHVLGIIILGGMGTYLGIPESFGGSKIQVLVFLMKELIIKSIIGVSDLLRRGSLN